MGISESSAENGRVCKRGFQNCGAKYSARSPKVKFFTTPYRGVLHYALGGKWYSPQSVNTSGVNGFPPSPLGGLGYFALVANISGLSGNGACIWNSLFGPREAFPPHGKNPRHAPVNKWNFPTSEIDSCWGNRPNSPCIFQETVISQRRYRTPFYFWGAPTSCARRKTGQAQGYISRKKAIIPTQNKEYRKTKRH